MEDHKFLPGKLHPSMAALNNICSYWVTEDRQCVKSRSVHLNGEVSVCPAAMEPSMPCNLPEGHDGYHEGFKMPFGRVRWRFGRTLPERISLSKKRDLFKYPKNLLRWFAELVEEILD